jgi:Zn-dependent protease with chaperone function
MIILNGTLVNAASRKKKPVSFSVDDMGNFSSTDDPHSYPSIKIIASPRIQNSTRFLTLPNGLHFETQDNDQVDQIANLFGFKKLGDKSKAKGILSMSILALVLLLSWLFFKFGITESTNKVANMIPVEVLVQQGEEAYSNISDVHFTDSKLDSKRIDSLTAQFKTLLPIVDNGFNYQLHIKESKTLGANAFAFPSGDIVVTDGLINLAKDDHEIMAVLLHEIGHVENRHAMRSLVQSSTLLLIAITVSGDLASLSTLLVGLPAILLNSNYSRKMESEADLYAIDEMKKRDMEPKKLFHLLSRIAEKAAEKRKEDNKQDEEKNGKSEQGYFNSHPHLQERIKVLG